jgi:hypothetical protein
MKTIFDILLIIHITAGSLALLSAFAAMACAKGGQGHKLAGKFFIISMTIVFATAIPLSLLIKSLFLFLIALFSYYLAFTGWRYAKNRTGVTARIDWIASSIMLLIAITMAIHGIQQYIQQNSLGIVLIVFGIAGSRTALIDIYGYKNKTAIGKTRIAKHLRGMLGATIAALTAFTVTNTHLEPQLLLWLGPTIVFTPVIIWWDRKVMKTTKI